MYLIRSSVLYERLSAVPPSPDLHSHALPSSHTGPGVPPPHPRDIAHQYRDHRDFPPVDLNDHNAIEYMHNHSSFRVIPDGRPLQAPDGPIGPGVAPSHAVSAVHMSRGGSASGHDSSRQLPPLSQLTPIQHLEPPRAHGHSQTHSPHLHPHSNGSSRSQSSPSRSRGHQISSQAPPPGYHSGGVPHPQQYSQDPLIPVQHGHHSPPHPTDRERSSRRHETLDRGSYHGDPYSHSRQHSSHSSTIASPNTRASRIHNHQRPGPGAVINHPDPEYERDLERERERGWTRHEGESAREYASSGVIHPSPPSHLRPRPHVDRADYPYPREPIGPGMHGRSSRSDTSGSGSGSGSGNGGGDGLSRPEAHPQYYDRDRGPYVPRQANPPRNPSEDQDIIYEEGRSYSRDRTGGHYVLPDQHRPPAESSRKRSRKDMEIDAIDDVDDSPAAGSSGGGGEAPSRFAGGHLADDRGSKRLHQEPVRSHEREEEEEDEASDT